MSQQEPRTLEGTLRRSGVWQGVGLLMTYLRAERYLIKEGELIGLVYCQPHERN
jgi:hypothetical protein